MMRDDDMFEKLKVARVVKNVDHTIKSITKNGAQFGLFGDESTNVGAQRFVDRYDDDRVAVACIFGNRVFWRVHRIYTKRQFRLETQLKQAVAKVFVANQYLFECEPVDAISGLVDGSNAVAVNCNKSD
ncbi:hypothetical protein DERF_014003 [Dermatophagoides farinae]|uniref:Uncharacterized protein n=1 Tax=Dermatophagoides farinae TaxID=6954 RepID=A0A922HSD7_DERFA|nr:hypothetical protein DERF_014003 [Dermatophagoides farinae]